ncbi:MAG: ABC transporter ATP-binding protein [Bacteriovoracaceae bacterium]|nr:ABC transporter ATP-binding protein [Bacteriovoracaceae bacterium]
MLKNNNLEKFMLRLKQVLGQDTQIYLSILIYGIGIGLLSLAIPISVQSLVNNIAFVVLYQPIVIISVILLLLLIISGFLYAVQEYVSEQFQVNFYYRTSRDIALRMLNAVKSSEFFEKNKSSNLIKRYFEIMSVQKNFSYLLINGSFMLMQLLVGLIVLIFYHPYFIVFVLSLIFLIFMIWKISYEKSLLSAYDESKAKYETVDWLENMTRASDVFQSQISYHYAVKKTAAHIEKYLNKRKYHFHHIFSQKISFIFIYALMSAVILALGGWLVIREQLTLGQLVASEIIVTSILVSISKLGKYLEIFYDLVISLDKIGSFYDIPQHEQIGSQNSFTHKTLEFIKLKQKFQDYDVSFSIKFKENKKYFVAYRYNSIKQVVVDLITKKNRIDGGDVLLGEHSIADISVRTLMDNIYIIEEPIFFEGSILDNLIFNNQLEKAKIFNVFTSLALDELLQITDLNDPLNEQTKYHFSRSQLIRLEMARAVLSDNKIIILTSIIDELDDSRYQKVLSYLFSLEDRTVIYLGRNLRYEVKFDEGFYLTGESVINFENITELKKLKAKYEL